MMRAFLLLPFIFVSLVKADALFSPATQYYVGESIVTDMKSGKVTRAPYLDARTTDPTTNTITEYVVSSHGQTFGENTAKLSIVNNHFSMTESTGTVTGEGDLTGEAWNWTFLRGEFKISNSSFKMRIIDYNFFADPNTIQGHKDFYLTRATFPEQLIQQEDVVLHLVDKETFETYRKKILKLQKDDL
jgi:hypothetical protein